MLIQCFVHGNVVTNFKCALIQMQMSHVEQIKALLLEMNISRNEYF